MTFKDRRDERDSDPVRGMPRLVDLCDLLTPDEAIRLYTHLHNGNAPDRWGMAFQDRDGKPVFVRSKNVHVATGISWAVSSIFAKGRVSKPMAFMPYGRNAASETCWGAFDFDAHDGNAKRARDLAFKAWNHLKEIRPDLCIILETSDSGGWHVWIIKEKLFPCEAMAVFLKEVANAIDVTLQKGICEIFPDR